MKFNHPNRLLSRLGWLSFLVTLAFQPGCSDANLPKALPPVTTHPVKGKVLLSDGKPLTEGTISFMPKSETGRVATGTIQSDGSFALTTEGSGEGAAEGEYKVKISTTLSKPTGKKGISLVAVPPRYQDEDSSGLIINVKSGGNDLEPIRLR